MPKLESCSSWLMFILGRGAGRICDFLNVDELGNWILGSRGL